MGAKRKDEAPWRIIDNLRMLREALAKEAFACSGLHHLLVAHNDDLSADVTFGPNGFVQPGRENAYILQTPLRGPMEMISSDGMAVLQAPEWTERGKAFRFDPMTFNWNPEARREFIARPGIVAQGFLLARRLDQEISHRKNRFLSLASDIMACLDTVRGLPQLSTLAIAEDPTPQRGRGKDSEARWMRLVHRLGWQGNALSLTRATRQTWLRSGVQSIGFFPHDAEELRRLSEHFGPLRDLKERLAIPPDRFVSELGHDVFTESAYAVDDIVTLALGQSLDLGEANEREESPAETRSRDQVFVSYCHGDARYFDEVLQMLAPAIKNQTLKIWHDRKLKPGEAWRKEIEQAMESARIGLLLVTPKFFQSGFIYEEELPYLMEAAKNKGVQILWIAVEHCLHEQTGLKDIQGLNDPGKPLISLKRPQRNAALKQICERILQHYNGDTPAKG